MLALAITATSRLCILLLPKVKAMLRLTLVAVMAAERAPVAAGVAMRIAVTVHRDVAPVVVAVATNDVLQKLIT
jgi:hypothetical protein